MIWLDAWTWRTTWKGRFAFTRERIRRRGIAKTLDEVAFYFYYHKFLFPREERELGVRVIEPWRERLGSSRWKGKTISAGDMNAPEVIEFVRRRQPEMAFAMCVNEYFGRELRALVRHGVFLWHEGITPEYRGLYSPFWAVHNLDFERIGYTLLCMNDEYDAGEIFVQGRAENVDPTRDHHLYLGHKAIYDSLPAVERFLQELEAGTASPLDRSDAASGYYSYPGLSDFIRQRMRLKTELLARSPR